MDTKVCLKMLLLLFSLLISDDVSGCEESVCIKWLLATLDGQDPCMAPTTCMTSTTACDILRDPCMADTKDLCSLIKGMGEEDLLCGWTKPEGGKEGGKDGKGDEEKKKIWANDKNKGNKEEEERGREEAARRAAAAKKREEAKRRAREEEKAREREEASRREREKEKAAINDTSISNESEGFISGFTLIEFLLACGILALLLICCCCSINMFRRWCRRRMTLAGPFEGPQLKTTNFFSHCWRSAKITMQQRRLSSYLRKADALLENPAHTVYLHQYHKEMVESISDKMGWSPILAALGDSVSLRRGSVVLTQVHQEEATQNKGEGEATVEILAKQTGVANPHNIMDEPGVVFKQEGSKK